MLVFCNHGFPYSVLSVSLSKGTIQIGWAWSKLLRYEKNKKLENDLNKELCERVGDFV